MPTDTTIARVDTPSGLIYGNSAGTTNVTYTAGGGCLTVVEVTVAPAIAPITGVLGQCEGLTTTLSNADAGGTWSSSNTSKATIDINTGLVTAISAASITMTYTVPNGCYVTKPFLVYLQPSPIAGTLSVCTGLFTVLHSDIGGSGTWTSTNTGVATANLTSGAITGVSAGTSTITYQIATSGCYVAAEVTVNPTPTAITGGNTVCAASTITLASTPSGGTWTSSNTGVATIGTSSGDVTGVSGGSTNISYTLSTGCRVTQAMTVNNRPSPITGTLLLCNGTSTLASSPGTGAWSSVTPGVATISGGGVVTAVSPGNTTISYTLPTTCVRTAIVTVNSAPSTSTGAAEICVAGTTTLSNGSPGGTWSSSNTSKATVGSGTGLVTGVNSGTTNISYIVPGVGCYTFTEVTVDPTPAAITGTTNACVGASSTLSHTTPAGTWTSSNVAIATVGSNTGVVTGVSAGTITITYTISATCFKTTSFTVKALPAAITGNPFVCVGTTTALADATGTGTWSSSNTTNAVINTVSGLTFGMAVGTATITYKLPTTCYVVQEVTVNAAPAPITGTAAVCAGSTTTLNGTPASGTWTSNNGAIATVGSSTGVVTGVSPGTVVISYALPTSGCIVTKTVTVGTGPGAIIGNLGTCVGSTTSLSSGAPGGTWASSNAGVASVGSSSGVVTGASAGNATISYFAIGGCIVTAQATVDAAVTSNTGHATVCIGGTSTLGNVTGGGAWTSSNGSIATVGSGTGTVTGIAAGTANITYAVSAACFSVTQVTVTTAPAAITGTTNVCTGFTITLTHGTPGGTWTSSNPSIGTVNSGTGVVGGITGGGVTITYDLGYGCFTTKDIVVNDPPPAITGNLTVCEGSGSLLESIIGGSGTWGTSDAGFADVDLTSGLMTGVAAGNATITYTSGTTGCFVTAEATVNPTPTAITGNFSICVGVTETMSSTPGGGTWTSSNESVATIGSSSGDAIGATGGTTNISYTLANGCGVLQSVTVNNLPAAITGTLVICPAGTSTLSSATGGGAWSSVTPGVATIDGGGVVSPVSPGNTTISYTLPTGCASTAIVTVNTAPPSITGIATICQGGASTLGNASPGGTWSTSNGAIATVGAGTGVVTGVSVGTQTLVTLFRVQVVIHSQR